MKTGRRRAAAIEAANRGERYTLAEACRRVKELSFARFDESVDLAVRLGVNPKHADQMVRGAVVLPHGTGKVNRVLVFAKGEKVAEAEEAGADYVGGDELVAKITEGWLEFDTVVATPDMMGLVGRLGKVLGPRGLMPNPRVGTVTPDVAAAVASAKGGAVEFRVEKAGIVHAGVGKASFDAKALEENIRAFTSAVSKAKPSGAKGTYLKKIAISSTMGPGVKVDLATVSEA